MKILFPMRKALSDPALLAGALPGESWSSWRTLLIAAAGERLTPAERKVFKRLTGRAREPGRMVEVFLCVAGRRSGKSKAAAVFAIWCATCIDWSDVLSIGERGIAAIVSPTERQGAILTDYIRAIISATPLLAGQVEDETQQRFRLKRQTAIEVLAASAKWTRGFTSICACMDETAFLPSNEGAANSDQSILEALRPSTATTGAPLIITSSPATTTGIVHSLWQKHFGADGDPLCLVVQSDSRGLNPTLRQSVIDRAFEADAASASAEYGGEFREPLSGYIDRATLERCTDKGIIERKPLPGVAYRCFVDASSGSGSDWFAAAVGHVATDADRAIIIVDYLYFARPPFDPLVLVAALSGHLERWGIREITGDNFTGGFLVSAFAKHGITYLQSPLNASELYIAALPTFTSGSIALLDNADLLGQLVNMRRKIGNAGKEQIIHMRSHHDDLANAVVGLIHTMTPRNQVTWDFAGGGDTWGAISGPRYGVPGAYGGAAEDAAYASASGREDRSRDKGNLHGNACY